ncbi:FtsX-like permease family protein, partial [candidate division KSB1 bacterium]|nr:FtsX-like permease family protein [candidate division KSB1 bacterium]NIR71780.1 FtsX-like permease family protein [candidate division KSB1 bacterium]NIS25762.1 FtsX-like permease family protein [candidate division KSB1 bacterium]NIT72631.1 FtsX-like permease family protein [candidate division KSB1 bacterium]NIU26452.1 FtsX-like permease family protein [candidate division KSB1 bacterium]
LVELNEQKRFQEDKFMFADSTFFEIFTFAFKSGNPRTALESPYSIILTEKTAQKYFGDDNPIGQVLTVEGTYDFKVTGVLEDLPSNSHFHFDFLASIGSVRDIQGWALTSWYWPPMYTYILLPPNYPLGRLESQFPDFMAKNIGDWARDQRKLQLQPVTDIRLHSNLEGEIEPTGNIISVYVFSSIAFFILLIACINFMNLATARSANRAKEVGLRKVVGAQRRQLVSQFFGESMFYAVLALILALGLVEFLLPNFNELLDKQLELNLLENWKIIVGFIGLSLLVGFLSGTYPAMFLSGFRPVKVLQEDKFLSKNSSAHVYFRSILVVVQFTISIGLIINASIIQKQLNYIKNKNLGFKKEQIVVVPVHDEIIQQNWSTIKNTLQANPNILGATATSTIPGIERDIDFPIKAEGMSDEFQWNMQTMLVDHDFIETLGMEIIEGRDFAKTFTTDTSDAFILNEAALSKIGWDPSSAIGKKLEMHGVDQGRIKKGKVIGVVKDFHFRSLHHKIEPLLVQISPRPYYLDNLAVKISGHDIAEALTFLEKSWSEIVPHRPFDFTFLDAVFDKIYRKEERLSEMFQYFSALAIFIGCLGLFGLASFTAEQRTKEIGIRKVLGASISNIVFLLSRELVLLIGIAFALASPIAYFSMNRWLQEFVYRIELSFLTFVLSGVAALAIALLTVSYQALKAALSNPVDALRCQ